MKSFGYRSNSAKTIDYNKNAMDSYISKNIKNRLYLYEKKNRKNNNNKNNNSNSINSTKEIFSKTTMDFYSKKHNIKNIYNKLTPSCLRRSKIKYGNYFIFGKRELAFHKSIKEGRKVFKYHQSTIDDDNDKNKIRFKKINSLYLTEALFKRNRTMLPLIDKDKSILDEFDMTNLYLNKNNEKSRNNKDIVILKNIKLNQRKMKERKEKQEYFASKKLIKKNDIISKYNIKEKSLNNYINNIKDYLIDKYTLDIKNEKYKVINEGNKNKSERVNDTIRDLNANYKLFLEDFYPSFNEYIKRFEKQREIEKQKDLVYLNKIYLLQKKISILKNKINKCQNEKEFLLREIFLQICIKEKKLNLPEYYKDALANNLTKNQIKEKYGPNLSEKEIDKVLEYKNNIDFNEEEIIAEKLKRLENDNIELMNNYNKVRLNNFYLNKYKNQVEKDVKNNTINNIDHTINIKQKILENIIKKNKKLVQDKTFLIKTKAKKRIKHCKLYYKVEILFNFLNNYKKFDFYEKNSDKEKIKGEITEEYQIIQMIKKIERIIAFILEKNRQYIINNNEQIKYFQNVLTKKKKIEKTTEQKRNIILRFEKERKKIFEKNNKILFIPKRKLSIFNISDKKMTIKKSKSQQNIKADKIEDYLYDLNEK